MCCLPIHETSVTITTTMQSIICPHCKKTFELSDALDTEYKETLVAELEKKHQEEYEKERKVLEEKTAERVRKELDIKLREKDLATEQAEKQSKELQEQLLTYIKTNNELKEKDRSRELELQKKLEEESEKIRLKVREEAEKESRLKLLEKDKQIQDARKEAEDMKRRLEQGSQQLQGEILELELENTLRVAFPYDEIIAVAKGANGADVKQIVKSSRGTVCGVILWEFKRTKTWGKDWIGKLKEDLQAEKANVGVIASQELPKEAVEGMAVVEGVWVCKTSLVLPLAELLRSNLYDVAKQKALQQNSTEKASQVFSYITSHEFEQHVRTIIDTYKEMLEQLNKERGTFERSWKQREGQIQKIFLTTAGIVGSIQGRAGSNILQIKGLELDSGE